VVPFDGGEPVLVREGGTRPEFDHTGTRIYVRETRDEKFTLLSVGLPTGDSPLPGWDEIEHVRSENAVQFAPSPDGQWIAFEERFRTYIAPFPRTGRPVDVGPSSEAYPVERVSRDTGFYLHWSADGRRLYWTLGPELFSRDVGDTFAFAAKPGAPRPAKVEPETKGIPIGFTARSDRPTGQVALVGARVITMAGIGSGPIADRPGVIEDATVLVDGNRIVAVGPSSAVHVPSGAHRVDVEAAGRSCRGIVDVHAHVGSESAGLVAQSSWGLAANVAFGVTTSHDPSNNTETVFTNSELIRIGRKLGPRLFSTGTILYGAETPFKAVVESYEDALSHLRRLKAVGAFSVKSYNQQRRDARQMIIKAGRELQMLVVPEGGSLLYQNLTQITDGHTGIEHSLPVPRIYRDVVQLFARSGVGYTPTLVVGYGGLSGEYYWYQHTNVWEHEHLLRFMPREVVDARSRRRVMAPEDDFNHVLIAEGAKQVADEGGAVLLGAHGQLQGLAAHWELWMLDAGRHDADGGAPRGDDRRGALPRARRRDRVDREGEARRPRGARRQPARRHPAVGDRRAGDAERPALRREDAERDRQPPARGGRSGSRTGARTPGRGEASPGSPRPFWAGFGRAWCGGGARAVPGRRVTMRVPRAREGPRGARPSAPGDPCWEVVQR
jgi:imidazolonepropionase-like amidohydrolase